MDKLLKEIKDCKKALDNHQVIYFPTETVMGLGVYFDDFIAYNNLNKIKNRRENKPYTLMVKDKDQIDKYAYIDLRAKKIIDAFMPGSITILLKAKENVPPFVTHNSGIIGIRIPTNIEAKELLNYLNKPLLVPSANKSGDKPANNSEEVLNIFKNDSLVGIEGIAKKEKPSTIISLVNEDIKLIREGPIPFEEIIKIL